MFLKIYSFQTCCHIIVYSSILWSYLCGIDKVFENHEEIMFSIHFYASVKVIIIIFLYFVGILITLISSWILEQVGIPKIKIWTICVIFFTYCLIHWVNILFSFFGVFFFLVDSTIIFLTIFVMTLKLRLFRQWGYLFFCRSSSLKE